MRLRPPVVSDQSTSLGVAGDGGMGLELNAAGRGWRAKMYREGGKKRRGTLHNEWQWVISSNLWKPKARENTTPPAARNELTASCFCAEGAVAFELFGWLLAFEKQKQSQKHPTKETLKLLLLCMSICGVNKVSVE